MEDWLTDWDDSFLEFRVFSDWDDHSVEDEDAFDVVV